MKTQVRVILIAVLLSFSALVSGQKSMDYLAERKNLVHLGCNNVKMDSVDLTLQLLLAVDTSHITNGLYEYWYDLGMVYYIKGLGYKQKEFEGKEITCYNKCVRLNKKNGLAYHNLALGHYFYKNFDLALKNIELYKKYTKKKFWNVKTIELIENTKDKSSEN